MHVPENNTQASRYCTNCNKTLASDVRYCGYCGREIADTTAPDVEVSRSSSPPSEALPVLQSNSGSKRFLIGASLLLIAAILIYRSTSFSRPSSEPSQSSVRRSDAEFGDPASQRLTTPPNYIQQAEAALKPGASVTQMSNVLSLLQTIPETAPESVRAKVLSRELRKALEAAKVLRAHDRERLLAGMLKKHDEMRNLTVWRDKSMPAYVNSRSWVGAYIMVPDEGEPFLRFVAYYVATDWLFIQQYLFKIDAETLTLTPSEFGSDALKTDNGDLANGEVGVWEWWDVLATGEPLTVLQRLGDARVATVRYEGRQYYRDRVISADERAAIKRTLTTYEMLKAPN